ncbi:hypothetical protein Tco_0345700 [Tanacetum coccineum]
MLVDSGSANTGGMLHEIEWNRSCLTWVERKCFKRWDLLMLISILEQRNSYDGLGYLPATEIQRMEQELWILDFEGDEKRHTTIAYTNWIGVATKGSGKTQQGEQTDNHQQAKRRQEDCKVYVAAQLKGRGYDRELPWCNRCKAHHQPGPCLLGVGNVTSLVTRKGSVN